MPQKNDNLRFPPEHSTESDSCRCVFTHSRFTHPPPHHTTLFVVYVPFSVDYLAFVIDLQSDTLVDDLSLFPVISSCFYTVPVNRPCVCVCVLQGSFGLNGSRPVRKLRRSKDSRLRYRLTTCQNHSSHRSNPKHSQNHVRKTHHCSY